MYDTDVIGDICKQMLAVRQKLIKYARCIGLIG